MKYSTCRHYKISTFLVTFLTLFAAGYSAMAAQPFSKGVFYQGKPPQITYIASGRVNKRYVPPSFNYQQVRRGARKAGATINVDYTGFTTEQQTAFQKAVDIWSAELSSSVTINIDAQWKSLGGSILAQCGPTNLVRDFTGATKTSTYYCIAHAEALAGTNLNGTSYDIQAYFNTDFASQFYYGADGNCPTTQYDYATVVLHELCHGLGFLGLMGYSGGQGYYALNSSNYLPAIFDVAIYNGSSQQLTDTNNFANPSYDLGTQLVSDNLYFVGTNTGNIKLYAPGTWSGGSSIYHVSESYNGTDNSLMTYSGDLGESQYNVGTVVQNIFKDMGWTLGDGGGGGGGGGGGDAPAISLSTNAMTVEVNSGLDADSKTFTVSNSGTGTLNYTVSTNVAWMSCSPTSGTASIKSGQRFNRGTSYPGKVPMVKILDSGVNKQLYIPPKARRMNRQATATINVTYTGFTDEQKAAYEYAKGIWEKTLTSSVTINVDAKWDNLGAGILGQAGATDWKNNFTGAPESNTYYPLALAEALAGKSLNTAGAADIQTWYNTQYADSFYYGTDGNCPAGLTDYVSVVIHELCHGLGFAGLCYIENGLGHYGGGTPYPSIYGRHIIDASGNKMIDTYTSGTADLASFFTSNNVWWKGTNAGTIQLYAPSTWSQGSSISHVNTTYDGTADALMTYSIDTGTALHSVGTVVPNMFKDMGWTVDGGGPTDPNTITVSFDTDTLSAGTYSGTISVTDANASNSPQTVTVTLTVLAGGAYNITIGSLFDVNASALKVAGITEFAKKPKIYALCNGKKKNIKVLTKGYPTDTVECEWKQKVSAGTYSLYAQPKAKGIKYSAEEVSDSFVIKDPELGSLTDNGTTITLTGNYFGTKKPKVYVLYINNKGKTKKMKFKVTSLSMNTATGESAVTAQKHKKITTISEGVLYIENKIGYDSTPITVTTLRSGNILISNSK